VGRGICPFNRSVLEVLRANNSLDQLEEGVGIAQDENLPKSRKAYPEKQAPLYNYMWPILGQEGEGTIFFNPDFHFHVSFANLSNTFDTFIYGGLKALKALRRSTSARALSCR